MDLFIDLLSLGLEYEFYGGDLLNTNCQRVYLAHIWRHHILKTVIYNVWWYKDGWSLHSTFSARKKKWLALGYIADLQISLKSKKPIDYLAIYIDDFWKKKKQSLCVNSIIRFLQPGAARETSYNQPIEPNFEIECMMIQRKTGKMVHKKEEKSRKGFANRHFSATTCNNS